MENNIVKVRVYVDKLSGWSQSFDKAYKFLTEKFPGYNINLNTFDLIANSLDREIEKDDVNGKADMVYLFTTQFPDDFDIKVKDYVVTVNPPIS